MELLWCRVSCAAACLLANLPAWCQSSSHIPLCPCMILLACVLAQGSFKIDSPSLTTPSRLLAGVTVASCPTTQQDVFSLACVIAELFLDGQPLFDYSRLLAYRLGQHDPGPALGPLGPGLQSLLLHMLQRDPGRRHSAQARAAGGLACVAATLHGGAGACPAALHCAR